MKQVEDFPPTPYPYESPELTAFQDNGFGNVVSFLLVLALLWLLCFFGAIVMVVHHLVTLGWRKIQRFQFR